MGFDDDANSEPSSSEILVVIYHDKRIIGLRVDKVYRQIEAVVRALDILIEKIEGFKGTSMLDGDSLAYVLFG